VQLSFRVALMALAVLPMTERALAQGALQALFADEEFGASDGLYRAVAVARTTSGHFAILDQESHQVKVYLPSGEQLLWFGEPGHGEGQLFRPEGIASLADGAIWVADSGNQRLQSFDPFGTHLRTVELDYEPQHLVAGPESTIYVAPSINSRECESLIEQFAADGTRIARLGDRLEPMVFGLPDTIPMLRSSLNATFVGARSPTGHIPIGFMSLALLQVVSPSGRLVASFAPQLDAIEEIDHHWHVSNQEQFDRAGRPSRCEPPTPESLAADLAAVCDDGDPHFITMFSGVGYAGDSLLILSNGIVHRLNEDFDVTNRFELYTADGTSAYSHRLFTDGTNAFFTIDMAHDLGVRRFVIPGS